MRKFIILYLLFLLSQSVFAQLEVKEGSFKEVPGFVNINSDPIYQTDDNDLPFAIIKVKTENINDKQRRKLLFEGNAGTFVMLEYKTGEVWVYLTARYADYIKISHPDFSSTEFTFPFDLKPKQGYELTLVNTRNQNDTAVYNTLIIKTDQADAEIYIDNEFVGNKECSKVFPIGETHEWRIEHVFYHTETGIIDIVEGEPIIIEKRLRMASGYLNVTSKPENDAAVFIDGNKVGKTPYYSEIIASGYHKVKVKKNGFDSAERIIFIADGIHRNVQFYIPQKYMFLTLNLSKNQYNDLSYGITFGGMNKYGWFASAMTNFNFQGFGFDNECDDSFFVNGYYPNYTGKETYTSLSVIGGLIFRIAGPAALRIGTGYGMRAFLYETSDGKMIKNKDTSLHGVDLSLGLQFNFSGFIVSMDMVATNLKLFEAKLGLGIGFKNK